MNRWAPNNSKNWQWRTKGDVSVQRSTPALHGGEWPCTFLHAVGSTLVYCYRCTNVGFVDLSTSAESWTEWKDSFTQDPPHCKPSTAMSAMDAGALSLSSLFRWCIELYFHASICGAMIAAFALYAAPANDAFRSVLSNDTLWPNTRSYNLEYDFISWAIQFATDWW